MNDKIVEKLHKIRKESAEKFDYDIDAMFEDLRNKQKEQAENGRKIVSFVKEKSEDGDGKIAA